MKTQATDRLSFDDFYGEVFLPEHRHPINIGLHVFGTVAGLAWIPLVLAQSPVVWFTLLLFPVIHAAPGLIGHRLLERNAAVGDTRWRRQDFPVRWFILANHRLTLSILTRPFRRAAGTGSVRRS